jgi:hypothetical protein
MNKKLTYLFQTLATSCALILAMAAVVSAQQPDNSQGKSYKDVPERVDTGARYLFYLHGFIIENEGIHAVSPKFGPYEYEKILDTFAGKGFVVISEARAKGTDPLIYAAKVVGQINRLLSAGVRPERITVVGASRGGAIAIATSTRLKNRNVNFVILAACGNSDIYKSFRPDLWGNVLSIWDYKDDTGAGSCRQFFNRSTGLNKRKEIQVKLGLGHGLLYRPLREWIDPSVEWATRKQ